MHPHAFVFVLLLRDALSKLSKMDDELSKLSKMYDELSMMDDELDDDYKYKMWFRWSDAFNDWYFAHPPKTPDILETHPAFSSLLTCIPKHLRKDKEFPREVLSKFTGATLKKICSTPDKGMMSYTRRVGLVAVIFRRVYPRACEALSSALEISSDPIMLLRIQGNWRNTAAILIQRAWRRAVSDPKFKVCRKRLLREAAEISEL